MRRFDRIFFFSKLLFSEFDVVLTLYLFLLILDQYFVTIFVLILDTEALRESKREMSNAARGIIFEFH